MFMIHIINISWIIPDANHYIRYLKSQNGQKKKKIKTVPLPKNHNPLGEDRNKQIISLKEANAKKKKEANAILVWMDYNTAAW